MNTRHLRYFMEAVDQGSINKAASNLLLSRSSLNVALAALEEELGFPLFIRSAKGVTLTENGKKVYQDCQQLFEIINSWKELGKDISYTVYLYIVPAINLLYSASLLTSFKSQDKSLDFRCFEISNDINAIKPALSTENAIILGGYFTKDREKLYLSAKENGYLIHELFSSNFVIYMTEDNPYNSLDTLSISMLNNQDLLVLNEMDVTAPYFKMIEQSHIETSTSIPIIFNHIKTRPSTVTILPNILFEPLNLKREGIIYKEIDDVDMSMHYFMAYKSKLEKNKSIKRFIDYVVQFPFENIFRRIIL